MPTTLNTSYVRKPAFCCMNISSVCMLRCKMCFLWQKKSDKTPQGLEVGKWKDYIVSLKDLTSEPIDLNYSGAEPLADERTMPLINFSVKQGFYTTLCTNGFLIDKVMANKIADSGLNKIIISLDGIKEQTHDYLRGVQGCYRRVMKAIDFLNESSGGKLRMGIQTIILEKNLDEIIRLLEWLNSDERLKFINFQVVAQPFGTPVDSEWYKKSKYRFLWPQDVNKTNTIIDELIKFGNNEKYGYKLSNPIKQLEVFKRYFMNPQDFIGENRCEVDSWMSVDYLGNVHMCERMSGIGNINTDCSKDIWYSSQAKQISHDITNCRKNCHLVLNCCR
jgi:MoaA/NifB/PqqE/SkfB family radical SAM enzyme